MDLVQKRGVAFLKLMFLLFIGISFTLTKGVMAQEKIFPGGVGIYSHCIVMPVGRILMIGRDGFVAALRFVENQKRKEGLSGNYEYFEYAKERGSFLELKKGVISLREPSRGFWAKLKGFLSFHDNPFRYADKIEFKTFELFAHPASGDHSTVYFWNRPNEPDLKVRLAPTVWKGIEEVRLSDPRIRWFGYDEKRTWKVIPIDKLWE